MRLKSRIYTILQSSAVPSIVIPSELKVPSIPEGQGISGIVKERFFTAFRMTSFVQDDEVQNDRHILDFLHILWQNW